MLADQALRGVMHRIGIEPARHAPDMADIEREIGAGVDDAIAIVPLLGREARLEIIGHDVGAEHADRMRAQMRIQAVAKPARRKRLRDVAMRDLAQRMHAGIGAARAMHAHVLAADRLDRRFQRALHRGALSCNCQPQTARRHIRW